MSDSEKYVELYKKIRPNTWGEIIGQDRVVDSLKKAVAFGKVPTAYGFFGPRGCGKTTAAFVLAKALNCDNLASDQSPCNVCDSCVSIDEGSSLAVHYISMANNGGVDDVRELMKQARLSTSAKKMVMILDEVHNLSKAAFDALLIPLEDTSIETLFIFCSTEISKVPETVLSRIQARKFNLVNSDVMTSYLVEVLENEGIEVDDDLVISAVTQGGGSVRATLSALEELLTTGEVPEIISGKIIEAMYSSVPVASVCEMVAKGANDGFDGRVMAESVFENLRNIMLKMHDVNSDLIGPVGVSDFEAAVIGLGGYRGVSIFLHDLGDAISRMTLGVDARILLEVTLIQIVAKLNKLKKTLTN